MMAKKRSPTFVGWCGIVFPCALLYGMLVHFVAAEFVTAEISLGSNKKHQSLGLAWGVFWLCCIPWLGIVCQEWQIELVQQRGASSQGASTKTQRTTFACISKRRALALADKIRARCPPRATNGATTTTPMVNTSGGEDGRGGKVGGTVAESYQGHMKEYTVLLCNAAVFGCLCLNFVVFYHGCLWRSFFCCTVPLICCTRFQVEIVALNCMPCAHLPCIQCAHGGISNAARLLLGSRWAFSFLPDPFQ